jgi:hypothetical protein
MAERERCVSQVGDAAEVALFVETFAEKEGLERTCELLDLAAWFRDYDIADYEIYGQIVAKLRRCTEVSLIE